MLTWSRRWHPRSFLVDNHFSSYSKLEKNSSYAGFQQRIIGHWDKLISFSSAGRFRRIKNELIALKRCLFRNITSGVKVICWWIFRINSNFQSGQCQNQLFHCNPKSVAVHLNLLVSMSMERFCASLHLLLVQMPHNLGLCAKMKVKLQLSPHYFQQFCYPGPVSSKPRTLSWKLTNHSDEPWLTFQFQKKKTKPRLEQFLPGFQFHRYSWLTFFK